MDANPPLTGQSVGEALPELLRQVFGPNASLVDYSIQKARADSIVVAVRLQRPAVQVVVKLAYPQAASASDFDRAAAVYSLVARHTSIRMPEIWAVDVSCRVWPWRYMIKEYLPGQVWADVRTSLSERAVAEAQRQIGEALAQLHHIRFPGFGPIDAGGSSAGFPLFPALQSHAQQIIRDTEFADFFLDVLDRFAGLFIEESAASLVHEDLHAYNLLFQRVGRQWRLASVLDFDKAWAGPAESDLARLDLWRGMASKSFWDSYRAECPLSDLYSERRPLYQLLWCLEYADPAPQHQEDTQEVCRQLGVRLPRQFN